MFKNWLKTTLRNLFRTKTYTFLNCFGLATGIACAGLIFLWVEDEWSYNNSYSKKDLLYSIVIHHPMDGKIFTFTHNSTPKLLAPSLKAEIPEIENTCRFSWESNELFSFNEVALDQQGYYADTSVFSMLGLEVLQGSLSGALSGVNNIVITQKMAERLFGKEKNVVGKILRADNRENRKITAVIRDLPQNSTIQFNWLGSMEYFLARTRLSDWNSYSLNTYVELKRGASAEMINLKLTDFIRKKVDPKAGSPYLLSMNDWRLRSGFEEGKQSGGRIQYVQMFSLIAVIILLIACINFMNIATAKSEKRAKEVGVRKVMGANRRMIIVQFLGEALLLSFISVLLGVLMIALALPHFSLLVEKQMFMELQRPLHIGFLIGIAIICGVVAGSYPALYLSSFNPVSVLKTIKINTGSAAAIRKGLVITQFAISIILIISTLIIYRQIQHVKQRNLGYDKDNLLTISIRGDVLKHYDALKADMHKTGLVKSVALSSYNTVDFGNNTSSFQWAGKDPDQQVLVSIRSVSPGFIETTGMQLVSGRDFKVDGVSDSLHVVITESLQELMGKGSAVGKFIESPVRTEGGDRMRFEVIGVIKDYVYGNMYGKSEPVLLFCAPEQGENLFVRINDETDTRKALAGLEKVMKKHNPSYPFTYRFVDDHFNEQFKTENLISKLARVFTVLAILISCLGLFGLSAYTAERRTKEIGIRKVLGAETITIAAMLGKEFIRLILISCLIGFPAAWWLMNKWLQEYAYRVSISGWVFVAAAAIILMIALITISVQSIKAAAANPVRSLRSE